MPKNNISTTTEKVDVNEREITLVTALKSGILLFTDIMIIILIIASIVSITIALVTHTYSDLIDGFVIIFIVIANALIGALTETRADNAISALQKNNSPTCLVLRDGKYQKINVADIVVGDVISLNSGDIVPADIRLITSSHLQCVEGALTG